MELPYGLECAVAAAPDGIRGQVVKPDTVLTKATEASDALKKKSSGSTSKTVPNNKGIMQTEWLA